MAHELAPGGPMIGRRRASVGVALDGTSLTVAWRSARANGAWRTFNTPCDGTPDEVRTAFATLGENVPEQCVVSITLMRPLAHACPVVLPRMSRANVEHVLARDWMRYVIGHRVTPHAVAAHHAGTGEWRVAFAPSDTIDTLAEMANRYGWRDPVYQVSDDALAMAAQGERSCLVIACDASGPADVVSVSGKEPTLGRRLLAGELAADISAFAHDAKLGKTRAVVLGGASHAKRLSAELAQAGYQTAIVDLGVGDDASATDVCAVAGTLGTPRRRIATPLTRAETARAMRGITVGFVLAAAAAVLLAFGIERWGVSRQLERVQKERADLSSQVSQAITARAAVERDVDAAITMHDRERRAARTSTVLATLAVALPEGSALTAVGIAGDSLVLEGDSPRSAAVYDALKASPVLEQLRLAAPLRQDHPAGLQGSESFAFAARIRPRGATR